MSESDRRSTRPLRGKFFGGFGLVAVSVLISIGVAVAGATKSPPSASLAGVLALVQLLATLGGTFLVARGRVDPQHAERASARLAMTALRAQALNDEFQKRFERQPELTAKEWRAAIGSLTVRLDYTAEDLSGSVEDWRVFYPEAVQRGLRSVITNNKGDADGER